MYRQINPKYIHIYKVRLPYFIQAFRDEISSLGLRSSFFLSALTRKKEFYKTIWSFKKLTFFVHKKTRRKNTIRAWKDKDYLLFFSLVFRVPIAVFSFSFRIISLLSERLRKRK